MKTVNKEWLKSKLNLLKFHADSTSNMLDDLDLEYELPDSIRNDLKAIAKLQGSIMDKLIIEKEKRNKKGKKWKRHK